MRAVALSITLLLSVLVGACDSGDSADGGSTVSRDDLLEICESARECSLELCSDEAEARNALGDRPEWDETCYESCDAAGCNEDGSCTECVFACEAERSAAHDAWVDEKTALQAAYSDCTASCRTIEGQDLLGPEDCRTGRWAEEPALCAEKIGVQILEPVDCAEAVAAADLGDES